MEKKDDFYIPEEMAEWIGLKKSQYLSKLIEQQEAGDISFEEFHQFESFVITTIERPDKSFEKMEDDQIIRTYVRSYSERSGFHQVVVGVMIIDNDKSVVFVPILFFVSRKDALISSFCDGKVLSTPTLN